MTRWKYLRNTLLRTTIISKQLWQHLTIETFNIGDHAWKRREIDGDDGFLCQKNLNSRGYWVGK